MDIAANLPVLLAALVIEALAGYPRAVHGLVRHPVEWIGALISYLDRILNRTASSDTARRGYGIAALLAILLAAVAPAALLQAALFALLPGVAAIALLGLVTSSLFAQRSLWRHVAAVADGLERGGIAGGRETVRHLVGRDPERLDVHGIARAAIESLAENFSDAVVAPALWCALFGLPGAAAYKAVNTADSMIGHRTQRHAAFGWAAARLDDLVNLPASRLAALWLVLAACLQPDADPRAALQAVRRDARHHRSPNAGWPEAAVAGALGLKLNGPKVYGDTVREDAWMGEGRAEAEPADIRRALSLYRLACALQIAAVAVLAGLIWRA